MAGSIETIFSPAMLPYYEVKGKTVVIIDILRATSSICVAFKHGVKRILPVETPEEAKLFRDFDFIIAAERNAVKLDGFDLGNSPFEFENNLLIDKSIAFTTTNGTRAIKLARTHQAKKILIGSFLNLSALCNKLEEHQDDSVVLLCAGWKDKFNLEDTLFAGAVIEKLQSKFEIASDASKAARQLYQMSSSQLTGTLRQTAHAGRFKLLQGNTDDIAFCAQIDTVDLVPELEGEYLVALSKAIASSLH